MCYVPVGVDWLLWSYFGFVAKYLFINIFKSHTIYTIDLEPFWTIITYLKSGYPEQENQWPFIGKMENLQVTEVGLYFKFCF